MAKRNAIKAYEKVAKTVKERQDFEQGTEKSSDKIKHDPKYQKNASKSTSDLFEVDLHMTCVHVETRIIKTNTTNTIGEPIFDISIKAAESLGITRDEYRKMLNSKEGYDFLIKHD